MPRTERPLDHDDGPLTRFAADLRLLRQKAGSPPYRELARRAHYSSTTLADAAAGRRLPSLAVTLAYVRACGGDTNGWEDRWRALATELSILESERAGTELADDGPPCPYVGLAAFGPDDEQWFFGRERLTGDLVTRVAAGRFVAVFGASGSGKSSLLRAGLLARLRAGEIAGGEGWPSLAFTPGPHPLEECAARIAALGGGSASTLLRELRADPRALHLGVLQALAGRPGSADVLLVVDQFEETFTLCADRRERTAFISALVTAAGAANSRTRIVLGVRADFYPACTEHPDLVDALRDTQVLVGPMSTDELRRAVSLPATKAGCAVDSGLLARIVADATGQAGVLPLVSHALRETWSRRRGNTLTLAGYEAAGGIQYALARSAENVFESLDGEQRRLARFIFLRLVALGEGTEDTKRRLPRTDLGGDEQTREVLDALARARLVTIGADGVEITHEALLHAWPRLHGWINEDRAGLLLGQQLDDAARLWEREHRDQAALYRGSRLAAAREWVDRHGDDLPTGSPVRAFVGASVRHSRRAARWRQVAIAALCVLTVLTSAAAVFAARQRSVALDERDRAIADRLTLQAEQLSRTDASLAAELTAAAYRLSPAPETYTDLLGTENLPLSVPLAGHPDVIYAVAYSPSGRTLASAGYDGAIRLWNIADPAHPAPLGKPLTGHAHAVYWLQFSPDGRTLASAGRDRTVRLWNVADPAHPAPLGKPLTGHTDIVFSVSFSPDGRTLASAGVDRTVRLWNVADPAHPAPLGNPLTGHTDAVASATFSPDGRTVASLGHDHTIRLWNVTDPAHPAPWGPPLTGHTDTVYAAAFSPDARTMATVGNDRTVRLWNVADPAHPAPLGKPLTGHTDTIYTVSFSPDGRTVATAGADQAIRLWNVTDPAHAIELGQPLTGNAGYVFAVSFGPDGRTLASAGGDRTVRLWTLPATRLTGHTAAVNTVAFSPDGRTMASGSTDFTIRLWNTTDPEHPARLGPPLTGHTNAINRLAFSPDGRLLATAGRDHTVRLWNVADPANPVPLGAPLTGHTESVLTVAFSPDGRTLATGSADLTIRLWNATDPAHPTALGRPLTGHTKAVRTIAFSPDGRVLASGSADDTLRLWNMTDPAHRPALLGRPVDTSSGGVLRVAFAPNRPGLAATAGTDHTVRLWNVSDPARVAPLGAPLAGHTSFAYSAIFSPDGRTLVSSSDDHTVRLWDVSDPARPAPIGQGFTGQTASIETVVFRPDGHALATASDDHTVELTSLDPDRAIRHVCATAGNNLTEARWHRYVPELPFTPPCR